MRAIHTIHGRPRRIEEQPRRSPTSPFALAAAAAIVLVSSAAPAYADDEGSTPTAPSDVAEVSVRGERADPAAASRVHVGRREIELRPRLRPADLLEAVPGLFVVQHAGGGKANQYFLRGFDADHGTDVAFFADGVPLNMVSHAHGQGYTDLNFLIPELVVGVDGYKGPYYAEFGNFATAGAVHLRLAEAFAESFAQTTIGQYGIMRGLFVASPRIDETWRTVLAAEVYEQNGPFQNPEDLARFNVFGRITHDVGARSKVTLTAMSYGSKWNASGQIPARAVCGEGDGGDPCIDRFGFVDPTQGGRTQRHLGSVAFSTRSESTDLSATAYVVRYRLSLYSNFTLFRDDPVRGDQIEQDDDRVVVGSDVRFRKHVHWRGMKLATTIGTQARADTIDNELWHDAARARLENRTASRIGETSIGIFVEEDARLNDHVRFVLGGRADRIDVNVDDAAPARSGIAGASRLSPKWMAIVSPVRAIDLFADYGRGFHSNDARGAVLTTGSARLVTPATGYEVGARVMPARTLTFTTAVFLLDLDSELVWNGDEGTTEAAAKTRRYGVELGGRFRVANWLFADTDVTFTHAAFRADTGSGVAVPLAPRRTLSCGIGVRPTIGAFTPFGAIRIRSIADRPATQDASLTATGFTIVNANAGLRWKSLQGAIDVQNLLDAVWREVSFATLSRLRGEPAPVRGLQYSPGWPRTVMVRLGIYW